MPSLGATPSAAPANLRITLEAFADGGEIPVRYTCAGDNVSPALAWSGVPAGARSMLLIVYDADAGRARGASTDLGFIHWIAFDLPPELGGLPEGVSADAALMGGGVQAANDFAKSAGGKFPGGAKIRGAGYDGPCPPAPHHYVFRLMALSQRLGLPAGSAPQAVLDAMAGKAIAVSDWTGTYSPRR